MLFLLHKLKYRRKYTLTKVIGKMNQTEILFQVSIYWQVDGTTAATNIQMHF